MLKSIVRFSLRNKLIIIIFTLIIIAFGVLSLTRISIGAVPDVTNNQVQVITTSRNLSTQDVEQFITYPVELEMANLPGVKEIRSISKFGLSVVTIVFEDDMGTYLPRQLISEKIKSAAENIPDGFGTPEMGPISTGLGEIYQYVLEVEDGYKSQYSPTELRTIQDWIVKRQLAGIPGVVEVNTWGGFLKRYEVAMDAASMSALDISAGDVFQALERDNSVAGGSYIEKENQSYFIRGEGLIQSLEDIEKIVITRRQGVPVLVRDIGEARFGHATRFGAITGNGEGEKVLGQVMMLKNANSRAVIQAVKTRVDEISETLPPGVYINPFLERSELIEKTTGTITENLVLGCLIVVFVVVLLLGSFRSGLVVASVIPLSLLFALSLMYVFDIDANLMSLGAIDFGIIIDGAVIIVEFITFQIISRKDELLQVNGQEEQMLRNKITEESTVKMMRSAIFGQLIIIIVFIPVLALTGVEGKMFIPMALTFCFALIGAMILGFTYVPVVSSMIIRPGQQQIKISQKLISLLEQAYLPMLQKALTHRRIVISGAVLLIIGSGYIFSRMGAEFVPTLDEGDFVIQPVLKTGTSLSKTVETTTKIEKIVGRFPEVKQVVTRIGAAEVPTDPMSMEETDVIITLHDKNEWTSAGSKDELANLVKDSLTAAMPAVEFEFTQPIEMRFNELITGVRADLAIKVFGEDLDILYSKAREIEALIKDVSGAADIVVEKTTGLPQMKVTYDRSQLANHGLSIEEVNRYIRLGFAGEVVGSVYEGEKRFDLSLRYDAPYRENIDNIAQVMIPVANGDRIPLRAVADVSYTYGPAQISRDDTRRRIVVSVNVRDRDLQSVVDDVSLLIDENINLPPGYSVTYGGQFENLQSARERLSYAVPVSLFLIFIMLYFAFGSLRDALMIYSAIPLSAVGGILLLWVRDMPFSISAGIGFIALFGIAVLNGIVLIEHFKSLKNSDLKNINELIMKGAKERLRPVLLTASAAALGFLPMAVSTSAGAEVQRPLATVVIGGLVTATLLTLMVLPVLYAYFQKRKIKLSGASKLLIVIMMACAPSLAHGQDTITLEKAFELAEENNNALESSRLEIEQSETMEAQAFSFDKTTLYYNKDQNNLTPNDRPLRVWGIQQQFKWPGYYSSKNNYLKTKTQLSRSRFNANKKTLQKQVSLAYYEIAYFKALQRKHEWLDSLYTSFEQAARRRLETGETNELEYLTAQTLHQHWQKVRQQTAQKLIAARERLTRWLQTGTTWYISEDHLPKLRWRASDTSDIPGRSIQQYQVEQAKRQLKVQRQQLWPDIQLEYFTGNDGVAPENYNGFQVGVSIPILFFGDKAEIKSYRLNQQQKEREQADYQQHLKARIKVLIAQLSENQSMLDYYEQSGRLLSQKLVANAQQGFRQGEIDFLAYVQLLDRAAQIEINYLNDLWKYNQVVINLKYLSY